MLIARVLWIRRQIIVSDEFIASVWRQMAWDAVLRASNFLPVAWV
jgi:hypothetical protein